MPWTHENFPSSWQNLPAPIRDKALEVGNALIVDGTPLGRAIPMALNEARKHSGSHGPADAWVVPHGDRWAMKLQGDDPAFTFDTQREAIDRAKIYAKDEQVAMTVQSATGEIREHTSYA